MTRLLTAPNVVFADAACLTPGITRVGLASEVEIAASPEARLAPSEV
jgi:hypothetical protein